jgi:hypothetical protein
VRWPLPASAAAYGAIDARGSSRTSSSSRPVGPEGLADGAAYANPRMYDEAMARDIAEPCLVANFVEVWLAKGGHHHPVGINYLEKISRRISSRSTAPCSRASITC